MSNGTDTQHVSDSQSDESPSNEEGGGRDRRWISLAVVLVGSFMALLDTTIVNVALPSAQTALHSSPTSLEWIVSAYALAFGLVLVLTGRLGDTKGRKKLFIIGLAVFTAASVACGLAQTTNQLIIARIIQGFGAGCYLPQISATIQALFKGRERGRALGMLGAVVGASTAIGPIAGGVLLRLLGDDLGWRSVFFINLPIGLIGIIVALKILPETSQPENAGKSLDPLGLGLLTTALLLIEFPLTEGQSRGWPAWCFVMLALVIPFAVAFVFWELRQERRGNIPILPMSLVQSRSFAAGCLLGLVYFTGFTSIFFLMSVFWQTGLGHSPLHAGLNVLPFALASMVVAGNSHKLTDRFGKNVLLVGGLLVFLGLTAVVWVVRHSGPDVTTFELMIPFLVAGAGSGMVIAPNQRFVLSDVPTQMAGVGGAVVQTAQRVGTAIGVSAVGTVLFGSLHPVAGPDGMAKSFVHAFEMAMAVSLGAILLSLAVMLFVPQPKEDH